MITSPSQSCSQCGGIIIHPKDRRSHPTLSVLQCVPCFQTYNQVGDLSQYRDGVDLNGQDNYCRWCLDGGDLILCADENCRNGFCRKCITMNMGEKVGLQIENSDSWFCFVCDYKQLLPITVLPVYPKATKIAVSPANPKATKIADPPANPTAPTIKDLPADPKATKITDPSANPKATKITDPPANPKATKITDPPANPIAPKIKDLPAKPIAPEITVPPANPIASDDTVLPVDPIASKDTDQQANPIASKDTNHQAKQITHNITVPLAIPIAPIASDLGKRLDHSYAKEKQNPKRKLPASFNIFSSSKLCSKRPIIEKTPVIINEPAVIHKDPGIDLEALERELDISDNDSDIFVEAIEDLKTDENVVQPVDSMAIPSKIQDKDRDSINIQMSVVQPEGEGSSDVQMQDTEIVQALDALASSIDEREIAKSDNVVLNWALKDANILKERLQVHLSALSSTLNDFDENRFRKDPMDLFSWASNLETFLTESPTITGRCVHLYNFMPYLKK